MACVKRPFINVLKRSYCAAAAPSQEGGLNRVSLVYNAGSRFETPSNIGVTHAVRTALAWGSPGQGLDGKLLGYSSETRALNLSATTTREQLIYTVDGWFDSEEEVARATRLLTGLSTKNQFSRINTNQEQFLANIKHDLAVFAQSPALQFAEAAHKAAFSMGGLGNSIYMPSYTVGSHTHEMINDFMSEYLVSSNGMFVVHDNIILPVQSGEKATGKAKPSPSPYTSGEVRIEGANKQPIAGLMFEGASWSSKDRVALNVLAQALGSGAAAESFEIGVLNYNYSDTGLFGVCFSSNCATMGKAAESVAAKLSKLKGGDLSQADFDIAKAKAAVASAHANGHDVAVTSLKPAETAIPAEVDAIQSVSLDQVKNVAKKVLGSAPTMAAVGDLRSTPYLRNMKL